MTGPFVKRRQRPVPGSIPAALGMFVAEVRFYREIAPVVGVRVPACFSAESDERGTSLELEDLSGWTPGAPPADAARVLAGLHARWQDSASDRWPWLRRPDTAVELVASLFDTAWPSVAARPDCTAAVREVGSRLVGRLAEVVRAASAAGPPTLTGLGAALGAAVSQGILSFADTSVGSAEALGWLERLGEAASRSTS